MESKTAYPEWEERWKKEMEILFSDFGEELQRNLVAQGYEEFLFERLMVLFGSGFTAIKIIKGLREEIEGNKGVKDDSGF